MDNYRISYILYYISIVSGLELKSIKSFLSQIPEVFHGGDMMQWLIDNFKVSEDEASHLGEKKSVVDWKF